MCGIWCCIKRVSNEDITCPLCSDSKEDEDETNIKVGQNASKPLQRMVEFIRRRGPDLSTENSLFDTVASASIPSASSSEINCTLTTDAKYKVHLSGHVLWTQGPFPMAQPYISLDLNQFLLFNGDIYSFSGGQSYEEENFNPSIENDGLRLFNLLSSSSSPDTFEDHLVAIISQLRGPYAFIYFDKISNSIWFGRDYFGRQSLLFSASATEHTYHISSVSMFDNVFEIPTAGIYCFRLETLEINLIPFASHDREAVSINLVKFRDFLSSFKITLNTPIEGGKSIALSFKTELYFTDSTLQSSNNNDKAIYQTLCNLSSNKSLNNSQVLIAATEILKPYVTKFLFHLRRSVFLRLKAIAPYCKLCIKKRKEACDHSQVGVLFSGGLDSTVLAYLAAEVLENVDLLNVAFSKTGDYSQVPDRETALKSFSALEQKFCVNTSRKRRIRLVLINETKEAVEITRKNRIKELISPLKSVIDDSIGCCLWFAASGRGESYLSPVRTVLLGSGADELLGGYSRHLSAYEKKGWDGLTIEMQMDIDRISIRNMGRDNRVVSDHGLCPRMPYLDEGVVHFLTQECPTWVKSCPLLGDRGLGEKLLLRAAAVTLFGQDNVDIALFPKRAMQFGSRIAKLENSKEKGCDDCDRLL